MGDNGTIKGNCPDKEVHNLWRNLCENNDFYGAFQDNPKQALIDYGLTAEVDHTRFDEECVNNFPPQSDFTNALSLWGDELLDIPPLQPEAQTNTSYLSKITGPDGSAD